MATKTTFSDDVHRLPPEVKRFLNVQEILELDKNAKSISFLITGKTGSGKSTLTNGILGLRIEEQGAAKVGKDITKPGSTKVTAYQNMIGDIQVTVWDTPGLQDSTRNQSDYIEQMKIECSERDLTIYCIPIRQMRFPRGSDNPDVVAMEKLSEAFGNKFLENTIIVLTFADLIQQYKVDWESLSENRQIKYFSSVIQQWKKQIRSLLIQDFHISEKIVRNIKIVPTAHYRRPDLPGHELWLSVLWLSCVGVISTPEKQATLIKLCKNRFKKEATIADFKLPIECQPIIISDKTITHISKEGEVTAGTVMGGVAGASIGLLGLLAGPAALITVPVGFIVGGGIGYLLATLIVNLDQTKI